MLTQRLMDVVARTTLTVVGVQVESVTVVYRETLSAALVVYGPFEGTVGRYSDHEVAAAALVATDRPSVLRDDVRFFLPTADVDETWIPTIWSEVRRPGTGLWRVLSIGGGPGTPFYILQLRKVPPL